MSSSTPWFEEWFNSEYYLKLYTHRDSIETEACIDIVQRSSQKHPSESNRCKVLDVSCGGGRQSLELGRRGFDVTAIDLSSTLLHYAHAQASKENIPVRFLQIDMRSLSFNKEFDLAIQLFSSFGYFETMDEDFSVIQGVRRSLRDVGYYALDLINPRLLQQTLLPKSRRRVDELDITEERTIVDDRVEKEITIVDKGEKHHFRESLRLYSQNSIERLLREGGFLPTHWFGDYAGLPFNEDRSRRIIVVSKVV